MQELLVAFTLAVAAISLGILTGVILSEVLILRPVRERKQRERDRRVQELLDRAYPNTPGVEDLEDERAVGRNIDLWA